MPGVGPVLLVLDAAAALIPALVTAFAVVMGGAAVAEGWQLFHGDRPPRLRRGTGADEGRGAR